MSSEQKTLLPLFAYDIWSDGTARAATDLAVTPIDGAIYRWIHLDLSDSAVPRWAASHLPRLAVRTLLAEKTRPRADMDRDGVVLTLRGINLNDGFEQADMVSLRMWLTPTLVVSVRRQRVFAMEELQKKVLDNDAPNSPGQMAAQITESLVQRIETASLTLEDLADEMEDCVYDQHQTPLRDLPPMRREIIKLRRHVAPMAEALHDLARIDSPVIPSDLRLQLRDTANRARRSQDELSEVHERLTALADHLDMAQAARLERNGYRLSVAAGVFLPLGFLTGLFGVNLGGMPGVTDPHAFWWLTGGMVVLGVLFTLLLRFIRWF